MPPKPRGRDVGDSGFGKMSHLGCRQDPLLDSPQKNVKYFLRPINTGVWTLSSGDKTPLEKLQNAKNPRLRLVGGVRFRRGSGAMRPPDSTNSGSAGRLAPPGGALPSRGVRLTLTRGLSYPHEGFGLPSRGVWTALTGKTTNMQRRPGAGTAGTWWREQTNYQQKGRKRNSK